MVYRESDSCIVPLIAANERSGWREGGYVGLYSDFWIAMDMSQTELPQYRKKAELVKEFSDNAPNEEPDARIGHVRICEGAGQ